MPWQGGVPPERCYNLGYFDARLKEMHKSPSAVVPELYGPNDDIGVYRRANVSRLLPVGARKSSWANLVEDLRTIIAKVKPAIVVMPDPWLDDHSDHQYAAVAAMAAAVERPQQRRASCSTRTTRPAPATTIRTARPRRSISLPPPPPGIPAVDAVFSHPLEPRTCSRRKLFALESMHDLRLSPAEQAACNVPGAVRRSDYPRTPDVDYLRRGPRPEEIFFVYDQRRSACRDRRVPRARSRGRHRRHAVSADATAAQQPHLRRTLTLWDLVFYGIVLIQPMAPMGIFGVVSQEARGHVVTTILIGMFAMLLTAVSYGRMARAYPSAGSAFTYVGQELHPGLGYVTGWSMVMDYVLNPDHLHDPVQQGWR